MDYEEAVFLFKVEPKDFIVWMLAFCGTLFFGIQVGVCVRAGVARIAVPFSHEHGQRVIEAGVQPHRGFFFLDCNTSA